VYRYGEEEEEFIISGDCNEELGFHRLVGFAYGAESGATTAWIGVALLLLLLTCLFSSLLPTSRLHSSGRSVSPQNKLLRSSTSVHVELGIERSTHP
jgi:hypothetical protein